jgi:hypothetical protein
MPSFLSKLFGPAKESGESGTAQRGEPVAYEGLVIRAAPEPAGKQWRLAGVIIKKRETGDLERTFMRADTFASREDAETYAIRKGQQIIDEQGACGPCASHTNHATRITPIMPPAWCSRMWQWNIQSPGLSATKAISRRS